MNAANPAKHGVRATRGIPTLRLSASGQPTRETAVMSVSRDVFTPAAMSLPDWTKGRCL